jgi:hypothetical protein
MVAEVVWPFPEEGFIQQGLFEMWFRLGPALHADSVDEGKVDLFGCFSSRAELCTSLLLAASMSEVVRGRGSCHGIYA